MIGDLLLRFGSLLREQELKIWYPIGLNRIVAVIEKITNVLILKEEEAVLFGFV